MELAGRTSSGSSSSGSSRESDEDDEEDESDESDESDERWASGYSSEGSGQYDDGGGSDDY